MYQRGKHHNTILCVRVFVRACMCVCACVSVCVCNIFMFIQYLVVRPHIYADIFCIDGDQCPCAMNYWCRCAIGIITWRFNFFLVTSNCTTGNIINTAIVDIGALSEFR